MHEIVDFLLKVYINIIFWSEFFDFAGKFLCRVLYGKALGKLFFLVFYILCRVTGRGHSAKVWSVWDLCLDLNIWFVMCDELCWFVLLLSINVHLVVVLTKLKFISYISCILYASISTCRENSVKILKYIYVLLVFM